MSAWPDAAAAAADPVALVARELRARLMGVAHARRIVACSGGLDSSVLLTVLARLHAAEGMAPPRALHVDHGLQAASADWAEALRARCASLGVPFEVRKVVVERSDAGLEADARLARYAAFADALGNGDTLLLAHHRDDQAETVLLRLLRGAGPAGLSGMPMRRALGRASLGRASPGRASPGRASPGRGAPARSEILRPLLDLERRELIAAARALELEVSEDPSNALMHHDRNYLRHTVLPALEQRWPGYRQTFARAASACAEQERALADLLGPQPTTLPVAELAGAPELAAVRVRHWLAALGVPAPGRTQLMEILAQKDARDGAMVCIEFDRWQVRRFAGALHAVPRSRPPLPVAPGFWQPPAPKDLGHGQLQAEPTLGAGLMRLDEPLEIRFRSGGERLRPAGRAGHRPLKDLFQEAGVPPWERDRLPLLWVAGELVAVAGLYVAEGWQAPPETPGWHLFWTPVD